MIGERDCCVAASGFDFVIVGIAAGGGGVLVLLAVVITVVLICIIRSRQPR